MSDLEKLLSEFVPAPAIVVAEDDGRFSVLMPHDDGFGGTEFEKIATASAGKLLRGLVADLVAEEMAAAACE